jgi:two-component system sensor histidine kinase/response regulator
MSVCKARGFPWDNRFTRLPIIAMTAHATMEERKRCLDLGMNDHVSKPIDPARLFETLGRYYTPGPASPSSCHQVESGRPQGQVSGPDDLPSVEILHTKDGLGRVAGNRNLYLADIPEAEPKCVRRGCC